MDFDYHKLSENIKHLRQINHLNQEHVADQLNISVKSYREIENQPDKMKLAQLVEISKVFNISLLQLMNLDFNQLFHNNSISGMSINGNAYHNDINALTQIMNERIKQYQDEIAFLRKILESK